MLLAIGASLMIGGVVAAEYQPPFEDVDIQHPYLREIEFAKEKGLVRGYDNGTYQPQAKINRAEFMKIIVEALEGNEPFVGRKQCFDDVDPDVWYHSYVCYGKNKGIIEGYPDGSFKPAKQISFVEAAKIVVEAFGLESKKSDPWYKGYVQTLESKDSIPGSVLDFSHEITRGEMAAIVAGLKSGTPIEFSQSYDEVGNWKEFKDQLDIKFDEEDVTLTRFWQNKGYVTAQFYQEKWQRRFSMAAMTPGFDPSSIDQMRPYTCGIDVVSLKDFCEDCEKVGDHVATDFHSYVAGDAAYGGFVFTEWSSKYPSMCFELGMHDALEKAAKKLEVNYLDAASETYAEDVKKMIKDGDLGENLQGSMEWIGEFAKSVKRNST